MEHTIVNKADGDTNLGRSIICFLPSSSVSHEQLLLHPTHVSAHCDNIQDRVEVYRHHDATDKQFADINAFYHQVLEEDKQLFNGSQSNFDAGVFINGELHPEKERVRLQVVRSYTAEYTLQVRTLESSAF
ncbi:hypothetical protein K431DRAFT_147160 [Polychaeton citri CBS 116435]|uniref:Uncharacterized protein n=1 Tax=Polychaeton citri CBS 116435 TaxID=1314669 RepID=A0A9P4UTC9_9PEZI|nr:hypothetical protein K431DRAFT_147160 [Polychaeton citri CBS 116435]